MGDPRAPLYSIFQPGQLEKQGDNVSGILSGQTVDWIFGSGDGTPDTISGMPQG